MLTTGQRKNHPTEFEDNQFLKITPNEAPKKNSLKKQLTTRQ